MAYSQEIAAMLKNWMEAEAWQYTFSEETGQFRFIMNMDAPILFIQCVLIVYESDYLVNAYLPIRMDWPDAGYTHQLLLFLSDVNSTLRNGGFHLARRDGCLFYRTYVNCQDTMPGTETIRDSILCAGAMCARFCRGILGIRFNCMCAETALAICQGEMEDTETEEEAETVPLPEVYRTDLSGEEEEKHEDPTERLLGILKEMETECREEETEEEKTDEEEDSVLPAAQP